MQQPNVILGCYAKSMKFLFFQTKTLCNAICNNHMSYYAVMQFGKYLWYKPQQVHIVWILKLAQYEIQILWNTKFLVTRRCLLHRCLMRRGMPLTRSWFMPALNTQQFATVLTHQLTCFSHAEYHFLCDCRSIWCEIWAAKCLQGKFESYWVYSFLPNSHIHRHA